MERLKTKHLTITLTGELAAAIEAAKGDSSRSEAIERWLWRVKDLKDAAKEIGVSKQDRPVMGRPVVRSSDFELLKKEHAKK
tara:strand:- start:515 stop:760 length:246 start_codon:yes stop_codon:yes gene_type:complete